MDSNFKSTETYLSPELRLLLSNAQVLDGVSVSSRLRSMVRLWSRDAYFRHQVDQLAKREPGR